MPDTDIERLAYAGLRTADEVTTLREELAVLRAAVAPCMTEYELLLKARREEREAFGTARTELWRTLSKPAVLASLIAAILGAVGVGTMGERFAKAFITALNAPTPGTTTIEVHDAPDN